jgi:hypothetical protein
MCATLENADSMFGQKCIAKKIPVMICMIRQIPNIDPKFHHVLIFDGVGKSANELFMILING